MTETVFLTVALIALLTLAFFAAGYRLGHTEGLLEGERARRETAENMLVTGTPMAPSARLRPAPEDTEAALAARLSPQMVDDLAEGLIRMAAAEGVTLKPEDAKAEAMRMAYET